MKEISIKFVADGFCWRACVQAHDNFPSSPWCAKHHFKNYQSLVSNPTSHYFLHDEGGKYQPFIDLMNAKLPANNLEFYRAVFNYSVAKDSIRKVFAVAIREQFLEAKSKSKVADMDAAIVAEIVSKLSVADPLLYVRAQKFILDKIDKIFNEQFIPSDAFKSYIKTLTLPQYILDDLEYRKKNKETVKKLEKAQHAKEIQERLKQVQENPKSVIHSPTEQKEEKKRRKKSLKVAFVSEAFYCLYLNSPSHIRAGKFEI